MRPRRASALLLVSLGLATYFGYHAMQGRHGLEARSRLMERSQVVEREIRALEAVRVRLEREVRLLDEDRPDADFIDELARQMLGFAKPGESLIVSRAPR